MIFIVRYWLVRLRDPKAALRQAAVWLSVGVSAGMHPQRAALARLRAMDAPHLAPKECGVFLTAPHPRVRIGGRGAPLAGGRIDRATDRLPVFSTEPGQELVTCLKPLAEALAVDHARFMQLSVSLQEALVGIRSPELVARRSKEGSTVCGRNPAVLC